MQSSQKTAVLSPTAVSKWMLLWTLVYVRLVHQSSRRFPKQHCKMVSFASRFPAGVKKMGRFVLLQKGNLNLLLPLQSTMKMSMIPPPPSLRARGTHTGGWYRLRLWKYNGELKIRSIESDLSLSILSRVKPRAHKFPNSHLYLFRFFSAFFPKKVSSCKTQEWKLCVVLV